MANWEVKAYIFEHTATPTSESWITVSTITDVISGKLTLTLNDTSKLSVTVPARTHSNIEPVKVLLEVKHGNDRKFFGTVTKVTKDIVNGTMKVDAVGVLGSYQFLPNYMGYADSANLNGLISCESQRFRGQYSSGDPHYVASPWEEVYTPMGDGKIPEAFGYLDMSTYNSMHTTCNLDKVKRNAKNAYDFLKTVTKENNYSLPTEMANPSWFKWIEDGEIARFKPVSGYNTQYISYKQNLMSCTMATSPHKSRVWCYWNDGAGTLVTQDQTGSDYPNPFYYARKALPNKDDGSPYIVAEVANACYNELHEQDTLVEATAFDQHLVDNSVPWLDMGKIAIIIYYDNYAEQSAQAQITQIEYDLVDSSRDRVKLGKMVSSVTDSLGMSASEVAKQIEEYLPRAGGQMEGSITYDKTNVLSQRNQYEISGDEIHYKQTDESSSSSTRVLETNIDIVPLGNVPDFPDIFANKQPYVAVERKYGTSLSNALRTKATLSGIGWSALAFNADGTQAAYSIFNPGTGSLRSGNHTLSLTPQHLRMDSDRYALTCNLVDSAHISQGATSGLNYFTSDTRRISSAKCKVSANTTYYIQSVASGSIYIETITFFNSSGTILSYKTDMNALSGSFTTPANCAWVRFQWYNLSGNLTPSDVTSVQLEKGSSASSVVPFSLDAEQVAEKLRTWDYYNFTNVARTTSLSDSGTQLKLPRGWYLIQAQAVANTSSINTIALMNNYNSNNYELMDYRSALALPGYSMGRLDVYWCGYLDFDSTTVKVFAQYNGTGSNQVMLRAKKLNL